MTPSCRFVPVGPMGLMTKEGEEAGREVWSGRVTSIAIHPTETSTVYVGTAGGGVWKTIDAGAHWRALTDRQWTLSIGAIAIDPSNPDRVYAGTGEANITVMSFVSEGLLISDDAGSSWRRVVLSSSDDAKMISRIIVSPTGDRVFIGTDVGLFLLRPNDPPGSQLTVLDETPVSDMVFDASGARLFIARRSQGVALWNGTGAPVALGRTGDPATMFPDLAAQLVDQDDDVNFRLALAWIPTDPDTLFVAIARSNNLLAVVRSNDAGATWTSVAAPPAKGPATGIFAESQATYNLLFGRDPLAPSHLFIGLQHLYRSTSLGADWNGAAIPPPAPVKRGASDDDDLHPDQHAIAFASSGEIWVGNDGGVWRSRTQGETWHHRNRGLATMQFYHGDIDADLPGFIMAGAQDNGFQEFEGHPIWQFAGGGDVAMVALDTKHRRIWRAQASGVVEVKQGTSSFQTVPFPAPHFAGLFFSPFAVAPSDPNVVYTGAADLFQVDIDKTTWVQVHEYDNLSHDSISAIAVAPGNARLLYVADKKVDVSQNPTIARIDIGSPAVDLQLPPEPDNPNARFISDMAVSPRDQNRLYVVIGERAGGPRPVRRRIYRCDTSTKSWQDLTDNLPWFHLDQESRPPGVNAIHAIVIDPDPGVTNPALEHVYVGCDRGVFRSRNGGDTWEAIDHGLPVTPVYDLRFQQSTRRLLAFTHGRGAWMRAIDVAPCAAPPAVKEIDLYLRDQRYDVGLAPTPLEVSDPLRPAPAPAETEDPNEDDAATAGPPPEVPLSLHVTDGVDLKIDRQGVTSDANDEDDAEVDPAFQDPASTLDYTAGGPLDAIGFEAMDHRPPNPKAPARVYLQVHNRGPDEATNVVARVYWAAQAADGSYPDLPADFWSQYPDSDPAPDSAWQPIGPASTVASVRPAEPQILLWTWSVPAKLSPKIGLLAIVTSPDDPVAEGQPVGAMERRIDPLVQNNKRVLLKTTDTVQAAVSSGRSWGWLKWVGLAASVGVGAVVLYEELK